MKSKRILVTGAAGFIGYHQCQNLLTQGHIVLGYDSMNTYYDIGMKESRLSLLTAQSNFTFVKDKLENFSALMKISADFTPEIIIHLAAQAGVRHSIERPREYIEANILGTFNILEVAKVLKPEHLLMASTSSVYGANSLMPFTESQRTDTPLSVYSATKKSTELLAHSYANIWRIPITMFRFFTVYGPYGRPDMALFKFVKAMLADKTIDIYNYGNMERDFTYVDDLVSAITKLIDCVPTKSIGEFDSISPVSPFRTVNIGNSDKVKLIDFIKSIENALGIEAKKSYKEIQPGDVQATWADTTLLKNLTGYVPNTSHDLGVRRFVEWFRSYYNV